MPLSRKLLAEFIGTTLLLACVVGSGIMGVNLSRGNDGVALLANAGATAGILYVLITVMGPVSGAHFNPAVTLAMRVHREVNNRDTFAYISVQIVGAIAGVLLAHVMFDLPLFQPGIHERVGMSQWISEGLASFGLLLTILLGARSSPKAMPLLVAAYIFAAYWFTASTSFANPAVTMARALTQTFAGIRPQDVGGFVLAQLIGAGLAVVVADLLMPAMPMSKRAT